MRKAQAAAPFRTQMASASFPAPVPTGGWNTRDALPAMSPTDLILATNCIIKPNEVRKRPGWVPYVTGIGPVQGIFSYAPPTVSDRKLYAATSSGLYSIVYGAATVVPGVTSTSGYWSVINFPNSSGHRIIMVNGVDSMVQFDGTTWTTVTTLGTVATTDLTSVWAYKGRLYFTRKNSLSLWYLPTGALTGTLSEFLLGQICPRGGYLVDMISWSPDAGVTLDDRLVLMTSEGECIVYSGTDPATPTTWILQGTYFVGKPLGSSPLTKYGSDVILLTQFGVMMLTSVLKDGVSDPATTLTFKISPTWSEVAERLFSETGWSMVIQPGFPLLIVNVPEPAGEQQYVYHFESQAWSKYTGLSAKSWYQGTEGLLFGYANGVARMQDAGDNGSAVQMDLILSYNYLGQQAQKKQVTLVRPVWTGNGQFTYSLAAATDFEKTPGTYASYTTSRRVALWGSAIWGQSLWVGEFTVFRDWRMPQMYPGRAFALALRVSSASVIANLTGMDYILEDGNPL